MPPRSERLSRPTGFAVRLRAVREEKGLSQARLAELSGVSHSVIEKLERGRHEPAWPVALALAEALGVNVLAFVPKPGEPVEPPRRPAGRPRKAPEAGAIARGNKDVPDGVAPGQPRPRRKPRKE
jgi:transcriptional regulator with XRE-family HTH domain